MSGRSLVPDLPLNEEEASRAVRVFNRLRVPDVFGTPRLEKATGDWFREIVSALFGSYDPDTNRRAIQEVFLLVPKKNGKTTNAAAVMVTAMILNRRPRAELLLIAPTKEISDLAYKQAKGMIQADEALNEIFHCRDHVRSIEHRVHGSELKIKAADTDAITGSKSTFILIDETHVFAGKPRARDVFVEVRGALASRPDGFLFQISTQSKSPPAGVFKAELDRARKVRDGKLRLPILPVIYELPPSERERWDTKKNMERVNPNLGRSLEPSFLTRELATAKEEGPEALALFASQHANKEIGLNLMADRWSGADFWEQAGDRQLTLEEILRRSEVVTIGIDGGGLDDLLGFAVVGREAGTNQWLSWSRAYAHPIVLERRKQAAARLMDFAADGDLVLVERIGDDVAGVAQLVHRIFSLELLDMVGVDPHGLGGILDAIADAGVPKDKVIGVSQGWKLNGAIKTAERRLAEGALTHTGAPMMAWCAGNAKVTPVGNAISITKQQSGTAKIDPLMAFFNAVHLMSLDPAPAKKAFDLFFV